jgi:hypothetical protein
VQVQVQRKASKIKTLPLVVIVRAFHFFPTRTTAMDLKLAETNRSWTDIQGSIGT